MKRLVVGLVAFALSVAGAHFVLAQQAPAAGGGAPQAVEGCAAAADGLLCHQRGPRKRREPRRPCRRGCALPGARDGGWAGARTWRAYLSTPQGPWRPLTPAIESAPAPGTTPGSAHRKQRR